MVLNQPFCANMLGDSAEDETGYEVNGSENIGKRGIEPKSGGLTLFRSGPSIVNSEGNTAEGNGLSNSDADIMGEGHNS